MIESRSGSIFEVEAEALVNPVNCIGVSGAGLAKQYKDAYPANFELYNTVCGKGKLKIGQILVTQIRVEPRCYIVNLPTKIHWKDPSQLFWVHRGLIALLRWARREHIQSIAMPRIGCGLGGLPWPEVRALIVRIFGPVKFVKVILLE